MYFEYLMPSLYKNWLKVLIEVAICYYGAKIAVFLFDFMRDFTQFNRLSFICCLLCCCFQLLAQPYTNIEVNKPEQYQNRLLPSEKTGNKKFTIPKRLYHNTVSEYNYYFNAHQKLNEIINHAKQNFKEDYTKLLPFYNYSLSETAKGQIDSVLYKCTAGILLHDLRSDWVDQFYLLMGKAYFYRQDFDSAYQVFQYINYAFSPKDDGYDIPIGSNISGRNGSFSISSNEKRNFWKKISSSLPARNESFLWQVRNLIEQKKIPEAASLLEIIRVDHLFPYRLKNHWYEMEAYLNYSEQHYDSAAYYIIKALPTTENKTEHARWEYLAAQMLSLSGKDSLAISYFENAIKHTTDPLLDVNARLNITSLSAENKPNAIQQNLKALLIMAKRDRYQGFRDIIYYAAAELEIKQKKWTDAAELLQKCIAAIDNNELLKSRAYLLLGNLSYNEKKYIQTANFYDSINIGILDPSLQKQVNFKKPTYKDIATNMVIINHQDSIQKIAAMEEPARTILVKNIWKRLRKEKGLKEPSAEISYGSNFISPSSTDIFQLSNTDFYFSSSNLKTKGLNEFKLKWGNRPNIDQWRRQSAVDKSFSTTPNDPGIFLQPDQSKPSESQIDFESLFSDLPLTMEKRAQSNDMIIAALLKNGALFQYQLDDIPAAIEIYESILNRFQESPQLENVWLELSNCYRKIGDISKANLMKNKLANLYPTGKSTTQLVQLSAPKNNKPTELYLEIYHNFLEGKYDLAKKGKTKADELYGQSFWTPQLLYIEAIYYVHQKNDSAAIHTLQQIVSLFGNAEIADKAKNMIEVIKRRSEIENHLTQLTIERIEDIPTRNIDLNNTNPTITQPIKKDSSIAKILGNPIVSPSFIEQKKSPIELPADAFQFNANDSQYVVVILHKVDPVFITEGKNAFNRFNQEHYYTQKIPLTIYSLNDSTKLFLMGPFVNASAAITYIDKTKPMAETSIIPWLDKEKYKIILISHPNLSLVQKQLEIQTYTRFLTVLFPNKF